MTKQTQEELLKLLDLGIGEVEQEDELPQTYRRH